MKGKGHHVNNEATNSYPLTKKCVLSKNYIIRGKSLISFMFGSPCDHK